MLRWSYTLINLFLTVATCQLTQKIQNQYTIFEWILLGLMFTSLTIGYRYANKILSIIIFALSFLFFFSGIFGIFILLLLFCILLGLLYKYQGNLLYMPVIPNCAKSPSQNPMGYRQPGKQHSDYEQLTIKTQDGINIRGWILKHQNPERIIVYFHENAGNIGFRIPFINAIRLYTNSTVILVAYRGYSDSEGSPSENGLKLDAQAIINKAKEYRRHQGRDLNIYVFGRSLGGAVAIHICSSPKFKDDIKGVILENTFTSISDMIDVLMPLLRPFKFISTNKWGSIDLIGKITMPILFIKSLRDELVPTAHMNLLMKKAQNSIYVADHEIQMGDHNNSWEIDRVTYFQQFNQFLKHQKVR